MGAFVIFLFFSYINENIAKRQNELTFPLNIESEVSPADPYNLQIRRYKEEYYDPFLQDIKPETTQYTKEILDDPIYTFYKDDDITELERFYFDHPVPSRRYNDYITLQRNAEISPENHCLQSRRNYNDFYPQDENLYKDMQNAELLKWSDREEILKSRAKEFEPQDFPNSNTFYVQNKSTADNYRISEKPKSNENIIANPEFDERLKLYDNSFMQIPLKYEYGLDNAYVPNISAIDESKGVIKKYNEFSERIPLDNVYNRYANQKPCHNFVGKYKTPNEADDLNDKTHLKHSLTSSASAVENRLLSSHIKRTFDKVKGEENNIPKSQLHYSPLWKSQLNEKYKNSFENKLRNLYAENNYKDVQKIMEQPKTPTTSSTLSQHIANQQNYGTKPFESQNTFDYSALSGSPLSDKSGNKLTEIHSPVNQLCKETSRENSFNQRTMEEIPINLSRPYMETTTTQIMPSHYDLNKNIKHIEATQKEPLQRYEKLNTSPTFDVDYKLINNCPQLIDVNNPVESYKHRNYDTILNLKSPDKASLTSFDIREYSTDHIKASYNPSNMKSSILCNENKKNDNGNYYNRTNGEGAFIEPDLAKETVIVQSEINNIIPEHIKTSINQMPRSYLERSNLTSNNGDTMNKDNISSVLNKISEVNPSVDEPVINYPNAIPKKDQNNCIKYYSHPLCADLPQHISHNFQDKGRNYNSPINVLPTPLHASPQQPAINVKPHRHSTPAVPSAVPYAIQAPNNSLYEINTPKVTILNPTNAVQKNPQRHQNPTFYYIPSSTYQHIRSDINAPEVQVLSPNYTTLNPIKSTSSNAKGLTHTGYQILSSVNQYNSRLSTSLNNIASIIVNNILSSLNKDISKSLRKPLSQSSNFPTSCEISTFEVTHPCIESPRHLPETLIKTTKEDSVSTSSNKSSKPCISSITINVLPPAQQTSNDIIILV